MPDGQERKKTRHVFLVLRIGVVCAAVFLGIRWARQPETWTGLVDTFSRLNPWLFLLALAIFMAGQVLVGFRWWLLLRSQDIHIGIWPAVKLHYLGLFYNNFMPSSVGGDLVRAWYVTKHSHRKFESALSVFVDRVIGLLSTFVIAGVFYFLFLRGQGIAEEIQGGGDGLASNINQHKMVILIVLGSIVAVFILVLLTSGGRAILVSLKNRIFDLATKILSKLRDAAVLYSKKPLTILMAFALTVAMQMTTITGFYLLGRNLGIDVSIKYFFVFFTMTWVLGAVPVSIGGAGVVEGTLYYLFVKFASVAKAPAMGIVLCQRAVWMLASLPGAFVHLSGSHLPKDRGDLQADNCD